MTGTVGIVIEHIWYNIFGEGQAPNPELSLDTLASKPSRPDQ